MHGLWKLIPQSPGTSRKDISLKDGQILFDHLDGSALTGQVMKKLFSLLLTFVFLNVQAMAISGGPKYDDQANVDIVGTYSGVLIPTDPTQGATSVSSGSGTALTPESINSMGIFTLGVPVAGPATGSFLAFTEGIIFSGTITAVGDPGKGTLNGLLEANYDYTLSFFDGTTIQSLDVQAQVTGTLQAEIEALDSNIASIQSLLLAIQRIEGTASMAVNLGFVDADGKPVIDSIITFTVDGVKQSATVVTAELETDFGG